ncbi:MAG: hypothetical protein GXX85_10050 [Ignavibacteria bacterium]|nr:hypothetical protein [Ignavibacteria bacterium]
MKLIPLDIDFCNSKACCNDLLKNENHQDIIETVLYYLNKRGCKSFQKVCAFIRDIVLLPEQTDYHKQFCRLLFGSGMIGKLEKEILSQNYFKRTAAIYSLAKICSRKSTDVMKYSLTKLLKNDPLTAVYLTEEIWWLEGAEKDWEIFNKLCSSGLYCRWGALDILSRVNGNDDFNKRKINFIEQFINDESLLIRSEALCVLEQINFSNSAEISTDNILNPKKCNMTPAITFCKVKNLLEGRLFTERKTNYTPKYIDRIIENNNKNQNSLKNDNTKYSDT